MGWIFVFLVVVGDLLVVMKSKNGFILWAICDGYFCAHSYLNSQYPEACAFGIYAIIGAFGYLIWKKSEVKKEENREC